MRKGTDGQNRRASLAAEIASSPNQSRPALRDESCRAFVHRCIPASSRSLSKKRSEPSGRVDSRQTGKLFRLLAKHPAYTH